jgi:CHASE3 domain sensor protein
MGLPQQTVPLTPEQVADLHRRLSDLRHNVNNHLALMVAALELIRRKPEAAARMINNLNEQPQKILEEIKKFSDEFEKALKITQN